MSICKNELEEARTPKGILKVLQRTIPDIVAKDIDTADEVPSCSKGALVDVKTLPQETPIPTIVPVNPTQL